MNAYLRHSRRTQAQARRLPRGGAAQRREAWRSVLLACRRSRKAVPGRHRVWSSRSWQLRPQRVGFVLVKRHWRYGIEYCPHVAEIKGGWPTVGAGHAMKVELDVLLSPIRDERFKEHALEF